MHEPARHVDVPDRFTVEEARKNESPSRGIELGHQSGLALRVVHPWRIDGKLVGYIELDEAVHKIASLMNKALGIDLLLFVNKQFLSKASWDPAVAIR